MSKQIPLDSEDTSKSVAEVRHMVRVNMLIPVMDAMFAIAMNPEAKDADRLVAQKFLAEFAAEAQGSGSKTLGKLSPAAARLLAKHGLDRDRNLLPDETERERVGSGEVDSDEDGPAPR